jgi:hypothetical protein
VGHCRCCSWERTQFHPIGGGNSEKQQRNRINFSIANIPNEPGIGLLGFRFAGSGSARAGMPNRWFPHWAASTLVQSEAVICVSRLRRRLCEPGSQRENSSERQRGHRNYDGLADRNQASIPSE